MRPTRPMFRFPVIGDREDLLTLLRGSPAEPAAIERAAREHGSLRARRAALWTSIKDLQTRPRLAGYPPRIFISYRWEDLELMAWCHRLAEHLRHRGYAVDLDQDHLLKDIGPAGTRIPDYVARIVDAHLILRIVTKQYVDGLLREWLLGEDELMKLAIQTGCAVGHVLLRDGVEPADWSRHGTVDLRDAPEDFSRLDPLLQPYRGLTLSESETEDLVTLLISAADHLAGGRTADALRELTLRPEFGDTFEVRQTLAHIFSAEGDWARAVKIIHSMERLPGRPTVETTTDMALLMEEMRRPREALRIMTKVLELPGSLQAVIRRMVGSLLDDLGAPDAALRHLRYGLSLPEVRQAPRLAADLNNVTGFVLLFGHGAPEAALPHLTAGAAQAPEDQSLAVNLILCLLSIGRVTEAHQVIRPWRARAELAGPLRQLIEAVDAGADVHSPIPPDDRPPPTHACGACTAEYRMDPRTALCGVCGATSTIPDDLASWSCPCCTATRLSPVNLVSGMASCPVCRTGVLEWKADGAGGRPERPSADTG